MKKISSISATGLVFLLAITISVGAADNVEVRGSVTNVGVAQFTWYNVTFPGFYYDK